MQEHKISKEDGTDINWTITRNNNNYFCLLYNDNKQKFKFIPNENLNCELFMIGGGGAGGYFFGGGGGAGSSYINNNYTFKKNKTYTFEIGTGGMCDIADINKLFKSGLILNIYNNTNVNLLNINFRHDDYSSLGIQSSGLIQSFNVNNITIPSSIFHNNTTYIWDGYIKTNSTGYFNVNINSKIKTIIWFDEFVYNNSNALIEGNNIADVKIIQLESNRFYNIKIIAYNDTNNSNNFNISFEGCELFNLDKNEEKYVYIPASDTILTYRNDDNTFETIRCKGGGNGGCGFFNKNTNLDGGCGGGSGINKIKGSSIISASYNGYDGAIGDYCGGGGGIMSVGKNNIGGDGKIIDWFNETLIFGAGGNAANLSETRNLGYGCGGNGGECCYYSKLLINNNGNNGCILIYVKSSETLTAPSRPRITEGFADKAKNMLPDDSISKKLIENSFKISKYSFASTALPSRSLFLEQNAIDMHYLQLADTIDVAKTKANSGNVLYTDTLKNEYFIFDMLIISKLYAIIYRLYWYHYNKTLEGDTIKWKNFCENAKITLTNTNTNTSIKDYTININNLLSLTSLRLATPVKSDDKTYNDKLYTIYGAAYDTGDVNISSTIINEYCNQIDIINNNVPIYHRVSSTGVIPLLSTIATVLAANNGITISFELAYSTIANGIAAETGSDINKIYMCATANTITRDDVDKYYTASSIARFSTTDIDKYLVMRKHIYLEALNTIFNTNPDIILATLKYNMYYYNLVVYNVAIQYGLVKIQNERININAQSTSTTALCYKGTSGYYETTTNIKSGKIPISVAAQSQISTTNFKLRFSFNSTSAINTVIVWDTVNTRQADTAWYSGGTPVTIPTLTLPGTYSDTTNIGTLGLSVINNPANVSTFASSATTNSYSASMFLMSGTAIIGKTIDVSISFPQVAISAETGTYNSANGTGTGPYAIVDNSGVITSLGGFDPGLANRTNYAVAPAITLLSSHTSSVLSQNVILTATSAALYNDNNINSKKNINVYTLKYADNNVFANDGVSKKLIPLYGIECPDSYTSAPVLINYKTLSTGTVTTDINNDLLYLINNVTKLSDELNNSKQYANTIDKLSTTSSNNITTSKNFYDKQQDLNKTINEYNGELENFNNISFYYKLVIAFSILLTIIILVIFGTKSIDNNSKISVYVIIIVLIIIAFIIYKQYSGVKEGFTIIYKDSDNSNLGNDVPFTIIDSTKSINNYKLAVEKLINKVILSLTNSNIGEKLNSSLTYIKKLSVVKNEKAEIYKIKNMNLMNSIEILKKNANFYYYMIIAISFSIIILNIGLILYLLNSAMIMQIIILCAVLFIILTYYISYYIHKSTRLAENKNYWSNYNPSSSTLDIL
jgi:hypothetical protein